MKIPGKYERLAAAWPRFTVRLWKRSYQVGPQQQYAALAVLILLASSVVWAWWGAKLQQANADQLVNSYLFENLRTFQGSQLSAYHTFLLKWPLFGFISLAGFTQGAFIGMTILMVLLSVAGLVAAIYWVERRPFVFGSLCLALAAVLSMVPPMPVAGTLLPVSMAMVTTRNIEYILYIVIIVLTMGIGRPLMLRSWRFWCASVLMALLVASDRLYMSLGVGSALIMLMVYTVAHQKVMVVFARRWLAVSALGSAVGLGVIGALTLLHMINIASATDVSQYGLVTSVGGAVHGVLYGLLGLLTNFGANPAFDAVMAKDIVAKAIQRLWSPEGITYLVNMAVFGAALVASWWVVRRSYSLRPNNRTHLARSMQLSVALIVSTLVSFVAFAATNHYYPVDARYEGVALFAGFIALATYLSYRQGRYRVQQRGTVVVLSVLCLAVVAGLVGAYRLYSQNRDALTPLQDRNATVAQILSQHKVQALVGDYWRVFPIKQLMADQSLPVVPLSGCSQPRDVLTSDVWQKTDLKHTPFAYLLALDSPDSQFPNCTLDQVMQAYGRPNASTVIAGSVTNPTGVLLFYDYGANHVPLSQEPTKKELATVKPLTLDQLNATSPTPETCAGKMIVNIVAHQDDDLLFMNPDVMHELDKGSCVRTVYITAGDAGSGALYWLGRQRGAEQAYDKMLGGPTVWTHTIVQLADQQFVTFANPIGHQNAGLLFFNLPDGSPNGDGFKADDMESLRKLVGGHISVIHSLDNQSTYSENQLVSALVAVLNRYKPVRVQTQTPDNMSAHFPDHSDHLMVGVLARKALAAYEKETGAKPEQRFYVGYPVHAHPENVSGADLQRKADIFFNYAQSDNGVCTSLKQCDAKHVVYGTYLRRQYTMTPKD